MGGLKGAFLVLVLKVTISCTTADHYNYQDLSVSWNSYLYDYDDSLESRDELNEDVEYNVGVDDLVLTTPPSQEYQPYCGDTAVARYTIFCSWSSLRRS